MRLFLVRATAMRRRRMADEQEGPYKVVSRYNPHPRPLSYSIVLQKRGSFFQEVIPDAGTGETARQVCNLLNKSFKEQAEAIYGENWKEITDDAANGPDVAGVRDRDQRDGYTWNGISSD
jgi:hypothetical protein